MSSTTTPSSSSATPLSHFDAAAAQWDQRPMSQQLAAVPAYFLEHLPWSAHEEVLDFGAGTGLLAAALAPRVAQMTAFDSSPAMLQVLQAKGVPNLRLQVGDAVTSGLPGRYHAIVSCMALHHVADVAALLRQFVAALHPGGRVALVDLYQEDGSFHGDNVAKGVHHSGFDPVWLQAQAQQAGLHDVALREVLQVQRSNGRSYPLFVLTGHTA